MLRHGRRIQAGLGREHASSYYAIVTLIVESVVPYTLSGIALLVSLGINSPVSVALSCVYMLMMVRVLRYDTAVLAERDASFFSLIAVHIAPDVDPPRVDGESLGQGHVSVVEPHHARVRSWGHWLVQVAMV